MTHHSTQQTRSTPHRALYWGAALMTIATSGAAGAQDVRTGADIHLGGEVAKNPYLEQGNAEVTAAALVEFRPWLRQENALTTLDIEGSIQARQFTSHYGLEDNYRASMRVGHRASDRLMLTGGAGFSSTESRRGGSFGRFEIDPNLVGPPLVPIDPLPDDVTVLGIRGRTTTADAILGANYAIDARRSVSVGVDFRDVSLNHANAVDYRTYGAQTRFNQLIDEATSVGIIFGYREIDYRSALGGDAETISAMGALSHRLDERWSLNASLGASRTSIEAGGGLPSRTWTSLTAQISLCSRDEYGSICIDYQRQPQPSGLGTVRTSDILGLSFSRRLSASDRVSLGASYSRNGGATGFAGAHPSIELVSARAMYTRDFNERLSGFLSASTSRISRADIALEPNVNVGAGIIIRLGQRR